MPGSRSFLSFVLALGLAAAWAATGCVGSNVTLGTPADDPEVQHRAPTSPPRGTPTLTPLPPATPTPISTPVSASLPVSEPAPVPAAPPSAGPFARSLGDPVALAAEPCASKGIHVRAVVPRPEDLDLSRRGAVPGIEVRATIRSGSGGFRHATLSGGVFEADLWARGSGLAAGALGKETCTGGARADVSFEIVATYRR